MNDTEKEFPSLDIAFDLAKEKLHFQSVKRDAFKFLRI